MPANAAPELALVVPLGVFLLIRLLALSWKALPRAGLCAMLFMAGCLSAAAVKLGGGQASLASALPLAGALLSGGAFWASMVRDAQHWALHAPRPSSALRALLSISPILVAATALILGFSSGSALPTATGRALLALTAVFALSQAEWASHKGAVLLLTLGALLAMGSYAGYRVPLMAVAAVCLAASLALKLRKGHPGRLSAVLSFLAGGSAYAAGAPLAFGAAIGGMATPAAMDRRTLRPLIEALSDTLPFVAGMGLNIPAALGAWPAALSVAGALVGSAALRGLMEKNAHGRKASAYMPSSPLAFGLVLAAGEAGLLGAATTAGLALAYTAAAMLPAPDRGRADLSLLALVGLSRRQNVGPLIAFASSMSRPGDPVRVVSVAAPDGEGGMSQAEAEEALVRGVASGSALGIEVFPALVTASSAADGLARAALERSADALVLGWGSAGKDSRESPLAHDALARASSSMIVSVRNPEAYKTARRLVVVLPSGWHGLSGTDLALAAAARAWGRSLELAEPWVVGGQADERRVHPAFGFKSGRVVAQWRDLSKSVKASAGTAFVIIASRPGSASWSPGSERLSLLLEEAYPESAICLFYLSAEAGDAGSESREEPAQQAAGGQHPPLLREAAQAGRIRSDMREPALVDAVRELAMALFPKDRIAAMAMSRELSAIARREPIELEPGVLLLHAHVGALAAPALALGARREGWPLAALSQPVKVLVMLCSPADAPPSVHLEALTQIATALRSGALSELLPAMDAESQ